MWSEGLLSLPVQLQDVVDWNATKYLKYINNLKTSHVKR